MLKFIRDVSRLDVVIKDMGDERDRGVRENLRFSLRVCKVLFWVIGKGSVVDFVFYFLKEGDRKRCFLKIS